MRPRWNLCPTRPRPRGTGDAARFVPAPPGLPHLPASPRQRGYIAVYVIAILVLLSGSLVESMRVTREQTAIARQAAQRSVALVRTQAARQWLKARFEAQWSLGLLEHPSLRLLAELQAPTLTIDGALLSVTAEDANARPDANLLDTGEWQSLLRLYAVPEEQVAELAQRMIDARQDQPGGRFASVDDFGFSPWLPPAAVEGSDALPPLRELLAVRHGTKRLHVQYSPLPLFAALLHATPEQTGRWNDIRRARIATVADAELIFGAEARKYCIDGEIQALRIRVSAGVAGDERSLLVREVKGKLNVELL